MAQKTGVTFIIPPHRANELIRAIEASNTADPDLLGLADHLRSYDHGGAYVCVAEEDFVLWPGGPDIRDYQIGGRTAKVYLSHRGNLYSNDPADLRGEETEIDAYAEETPRATCPVCGEQTIRLHFVDDLIGDAPMTGWITELDDWTQDCNCTLTEEQSEQIYEESTH